MRILITGGGTAGHVNPALAIADIVKQKRPGTVVEYVGSKGGIEEELAGRKGINIHTLKLSGLSRSLSPSNILTLYRAYRAIGKCKSIIREFKPDIVIGTGGYVCWPCIRAASALGVPSMLHESNAQPGFAVRTLMNKADTILGNFEGTKRYLEGCSARVERVGMPVSPAFLRTLSQTSQKFRRMPKDHINILSFGGSLGAHTVNEAMTELIKKYAGDPAVNIEHSTGTREYAEVMKKLSLCGCDRSLNIKVTEYIYDMADKMKNADIVICRSGASTIAELAACAKAAILIPSPNVTADQQRKNAALLSERKAAVVIEDCDAKVKLQDAVNELVSAPGAAEKRLTLSDNIREFYIRDCSDRIFSEIEKTIERKERKGKKGTAALR